MYMYILEQVIIKFIQKLRSINSNIFYFIDLQLKITTEFYDRQLKSIKSDKMKSVKCFIAPTKHLLEPDLNVSC